MPDVVTIVVVRMDSADLALATQCRVSLAAVRNLQRRHRSPPRPSHPDINLQAQATEASRLVVRQVATAIKVPAHDSVDGLPEKLCGICTHLVFKSLYIGLRTLGLLLKKIQSPNLFATPMVQFQRAAL